MTNSIADITEASQCIFIIGSNTTTSHPVIGTRVRRAARQRGARLIVADPRRIDIADYADLHLQLKPGTNIALLNGLMHIILREGWEDRAFIEERTEGFEDLAEMLAHWAPEVASEVTGVPVEQLEEAARMMAEHRPGALLYAMGIAQHTVGVANVLSCSNLQMLLGNLGVPGGGVNPLRGQNNVQGACDMGGLPDVYSGYQKVTDETARAKFEQAWGVPLPADVGLTVTEMYDAIEAGEVRCFYIIGENPAVTDPDLNHVREALSRAEFTVVQDLFHTETSEYAQVVLPAAAFAEKEGTFTNTERRIQRVRKGVDPPGEARADSWIITELARRLAAEGVVEPSPEAPWGAWEHSEAPAVMGEINALTPIYAGVGWQRLEAGEELHWPVSDHDHPGTPILHTESFTRGRGRFVAVDHAPPAELPDGDFPLMLTTGHVLYHWCGGEMTRRARGLAEVYPEALIEIHPVDARAHGINDGALMKMASRRGEIVARATVTDRVDRGLVFAEFHFPESTANFLTNKALDPQAKVPEYKVCAVRVEALEEPVTG